MAHDIEFKYILEGVKAPDDSTIRSFRRRHVKAYSKTFAAIVHITCALGMTDYGSLAIDGTKVQAYASLYETKDRKGLEKSIRLLSKRLEDILSRMNDTDDAEERDELDKRRRSIEKRQAALADFNELLSNLPEVERVNRVDKDARLMKKADGKSIIGYNAQAAVETGEHGIIVAAEISQKATDETLLLEMAKKAGENCGAAFNTILGDAGSITYESMEQAAHEGKNILGPDRLYDAERFGKEKKGRFAKSQFEYDECNDCSVCPGGYSLELQRLITAQTSSLVSVYANREAYAECPFAPSCLSKNSAFREIHRDYRELLRENMREKLEGTPGFLLYGKRSQTVETAFGNVKQNKGVRQLFYRGCQKVDAEWKAICTGINLSKIVTFVQGKDWETLFNSALNSV